MLAEAAQAAIERLAAVPFDSDLVAFQLHELRLRALLARARGDETGYREFADRYRAMAAPLGYAGHIAAADAMT